jgi:tetratricopeptide (TPR) repeat protein
MSFFRKMFDEKSPEKGPASATASPSSADPANDPNMIRVYDGYGRELFITKQQWKDNVLLGNLETARDNPEQLYGMLVSALHDGFAADIIPYAEHLWRTDPIPSRGAAILGIVYMDVNRLDDAERVLNDFIAAHGEDGVVLTNLAKLYSRRGDNARAESILWHALEVDPNQDNGLGWYAAIQRDRGGEPSASDAFRRVAALPRSWRAQLGLARDALQGKDFPAAEPLYMEALGRAERPVPTDLLMQMSGDLGNNGCRAEIIRLVEPYFDPAFHGLQVGNNLIKAKYDLGQLDAARRILGQLYAQKRHDWQQRLSYWDTELAKAGIAKRAEAVPEPLSVSVLSIEGPLWTRDGSPFAALLPVKRANAQHIAVEAQQYLHKCQRDPQFNLAMAQGVSVVPYP